MLGPPGGVTAGGGPAAGRGGLPVRGGAQGVRGAPPDTAVSLCPAAPQWPPRNGSEAEGRGWGGSPERDPASGAPPGTTSNGTSQGGAPSAGDTPLGPQLEPPGGGTASTTDPAGRLAGCLGCAGEGDASALPPTPGSAEGSEAATGVTWPGDGGAVAVAIGSPEEAGSGEQPTRASLHGAGFLGGLTAAPPSLPGLPSPGLPSPGLPSPGPGTDSAESDLLLAAGGSAAVRPPVPGDSGRELWLASSSPAPAQGARGRTDRTWLDVQEAVAATPGTAEPPTGSGPPASAVPRVPPAPRGPRPSARPPKPPGAAGGSPPAPPRPGERLVPENGTECRSGFVRHNGSCRSVCDLVPSYCHNGGQCYLVEGLGAFCRTPWHRCAAGAHRRAPPGRYRTPSELHNDNFSLSTIAEGSHPNHP
nr:LOW QUALITY PROTEIN: chondroitin sulfate proteoglycan 5 [Anser cygnoides]